MDASTNTQNTQRLTFAARLRDTLDTQDVSVRELSRRLSPDNPEAQRPAIHRWLRGKNPSRRSRRRVAEALGLPPDFFLADDEEEEDPLPSLDDFLRLHIERIIAEVAAARVTA